MHTCQVSRISRETHAFSVNSRISARTNIFSRIFSREVTHIFGARVTLPVDRVLSVLCRLCVHVVALLHAARLTTVTFIDYCVTETRKVGWLKHYTAWWHRSWLKRGNSSHCQTPVLPSAVVRLRQCGSGSTNVLPSHRHNNCLVYFYIFVRQKLLRGPSV